jgi:polyhydroxybutyrate depolymerase
MAAFADAFKFILVVPKGIDLNWAVNSEGHDVPFVADMIDAVRADYCIHPKRVFATGFSKGAGMAHRLACELADRIAAIGPVAGGNNWYFHGDVCEPSRPVSIIQFNGTEDVMAGGVWDPAFFAAWASLYGCSGETEVVYEKGEVTCFEYQDCPKETTLKHCVHYGGGHNWPGGTDLCEFYDGDPFWCWLVGETTDDIDASREIWRFFAEHAMSGKD